MRTMSVLSPGCKMSSDEGHGEIGHDQIECDKPDWSADLDPSKDGEDIFGCGVHRFLNESGSSVAKANPENISRRSNIDTNATQ